MTNFRNILSNNAFFYLFNNTYQPKKFVIRSLKESRVRDPLIGFSCLSLNCGLAQNYNLKDHFFNKHRNINNKEVSLTFSRLKQTMDPGILNLNFLLHFKKHKLVRQKICLKFFSSKYITLYKLYKLNLLNNFFFNYNFFISNHYLSTGFFPYLNFFSQNLKDKAFISKKTYSNNFFFFFLYNLNFFVKKFISKNHRVWTLKFFLYDSFFFFNFKLNSILLSLNKFKYRNLLRVFEEGYKKRMRYNRDKNNKVCFFKKKFIMFNRKRYEGYLSNLKKGLKTRKSYNNRSVKIFYYFCTFKKFNFKNLKRKKGIKYFYQFWIRYGTYENLHKYGANKFRIIEMVREKYKKRKFLNSSNYSSKKKNNYIKKNKNYNILKELF